MTARHSDAIASSSAVDVPVRHFDSLDDARAHIASAALSPSVIGTVGIELEMHLVDLTNPSQRVPWQRLQALVDDLPPLPAGSAVTIEPGGQVELSTPPLPDAAAVVAGLVADRKAIGEVFADEQLGLAAIGADPARSAQRLSPHSRYEGMEAHFASTGNGEAGCAMMCCTAALQINVEAGPAAGWPSRVSGLHGLGPVLVAISGCSPMLAGRSSGWSSMRQQMWGEIDQARCGPLLDGAHPDDEWAAYALDAPVMLVRDSDTDEATAVTERVTLGDWISGDRRLGRPPTAADVDYHLSTLFPPVRPRGFLELRCIDAVPDRWWPGLAGIAITLIDDDIAAERAAQVCTALDGAWTKAARDGLRDDSLAKAARACVEVAVDRAPVELKADMEAYAELVDAGRTPGDEIRRRIDRDGPLHVLAVESRSALECYA